MKLITLKLLVNEEERRGTGKADSPIRHILRAETLDGTVVFEYDPHEDQISMTANLISVLRDSPRETLSGQVYQLKQQ